MKQKWEIIFCGVGGQGLLLNGTLLGAAASILEKRQAVMTCAYGSETRGTFTKSDLVLSEDYIDYPEALEPDIVVALAQVAYDRYVKGMKDGSILIYNANQVSEAPSAAKQYGLALEDIAAEAGNPAAVNVAALGAMIALTGCAKPESVKETIKKRFEGNDKVVAGNIRAFDAGMQAAKKLPQG